MCRKFTVAPKGAFWCCTYTMNDILAERELVLYCLNYGDDFGKDIYLDPNATKYNAYNNTNYTTNYQGKNNL